MAPSSSAASSPACFFQLPAPTESQKANFGGGNGVLPLFPLRSWLWGPLSQRGLRQVGGGSLGWVPGTSLPARMGWLIYAHSSHRCFPLLFLLTAHTSNSWDAPRQPLITLVCRPAHIPPDQGASCLPPFSLGFCRVLAPVPPPALESAARLMVCPEPCQRTSWAGGKPHGARWGELFSPENACARLQRWPQLPPRAQGTGFVGTLHTFTDFPDFLHLFRLPQKVPLCRWPPPWGNVSWDLERGTGWGSALDAAHCPHEGWGQRATEAGSPCVPGTPRAADPAGTASSAAAPVTNLGKPAGPCGLAG